MQRACTNFTLYGEVKMKSIISNENISLENVLRTAIANEAPEGIGVLAEKLVHGTLKYHYCADKTCHEVKYRGFVADILEGDIENRPRITEIQTRQAYKLVRKLEAYGDDTDVTVVLPTVAKKTIVWVEPETGAITETSKTSRPKTVYHSLREIYALRAFINKPNIVIRVPLITVTEYRLLDGSDEKKKKRATKYQATPEDIITEYTFISGSDFAKIIPEGLGETFTAFDFARTAKLPISDARYAVLALSAAGVIAEHGKDGNKKVWKKVFEKSE